MVHRAIPAWTVCHVDPGADHAGISGLPERQISQGGMHVQTPHKGWYQDEQAPNRRCIQAGAILAETADRTMEGGPGSGADRVCEE